jgi:small subunit ribosomal protein S20
MAIMPITVGAIRKLRADKRKAVINLQVKKSLKEAVSRMRKKQTEKNLRDLFMKADRAVKSRVIHKNKAARLKSRLSALVKKK